MTNAPPGLDLSHEADRQTLAGLLLDDINAYCVSAYDDGPRNHLGISELGAECGRALWYQFRWVKHILYSGRMLRLFNRGHLEELRYVSWLRAIGAQVWTHDENGKQFRAIYEPNKHLGGSLDGVAILPAKYRINEPVLCEFKTKSTGSEFAKLKEKGVALVIPKHYKQACGYGRARGLRYCVYFNTNKNDDDMYVEVVKLNWDLAEDEMRRGEHIVNSPIPPHRISDNPAYHVCKICDYNDVCFGRKIPDINCRTCAFSKPVQSGDWGCAWGNDNPNAPLAIIPSEVIKIGCSYHKHIQ